MQVGSTLVAFMTKGPLVFVAASTGMGEPVHALQVGQEGLGWGSLSMRCRWAGQRVGRRGGASLFVLVYCDLLL